MKKLMKVVIGLAAFTVLLCTGQRDACAVPVSGLNGLDGWTSSYMDTSYTVLDDTATNESTPTTISSTTASMFTQGINSGIFLTSISSEINFDLTGTLQFNLSFTTSPDAMGSSYPQTVSDFMTFSFFDTTLNATSELASRNTGDFTSGTITCDISSLFGNSGFLYFDLNDMDDGFVTNAVIETVAFAPSQVAPVPEPSTILLLAGGFAAFAIRMRRRTQSKS